MRLVQRFVSRRGDTRDGSVMQHANSLSGTRRDIRRNARFRMALAGMVALFVSSGHTASADDTAEWCPDLASIGQMLMVTPPKGGADAMQRFKNSLRRLNIGSVVLYGYHVQPLEGAGEMVAYTNYLQTGLSTRLFIAVDHEGGAVQRLGPRHGLSRLPPPGEVGVRMNARTARAYGRLIGEQLRAVGVNLNLAPVLDVRSEAANPNIARWNRAIDTDPERVASLGGAMAAGMQNAGVVAAGKHFPGIGALREDTHEKPGHLPQSVETLRRTALRPFAAATAAGMDAVLLSHAVVSDLTGDSTPSSLAASVVQGLLRDELGFDGLAITDDLIMDGVADTYGVNEAALRAVQAGADIVLITNGAQAVVAKHLCGVLARGGGEAEALRRRIRNSAERVLRIKRTYGILDNGPSPVPRSVETDGHRDLLRRLGAY